MLLLCDDRFHRAVRRDPAGGRAVVVGRQVVLLSRDEGLASTIGRLLPNGDRIAHFHSAAELADWSAPEVAAVILDSQPHARRLSYKQVRERYGGPLIMLLDMDEQRPALPPDGARQFLRHPFMVAELSRLLDAPAAELEPFEAAIIAAWSRRATVEPPVPVRSRLFAQIPSWRPSARRRARVWAATIVALVGLLLVVGLSDNGSCAPWCTQFGGAIAGAAEHGTPLTSTLSTGPAGGGSGSSAGVQPPGSAAASSQSPTPTGGSGFPVAAGVGGLIQSTSPITGSDTTPTLGRGGRPRGPRSPRRRPVPHNQPALGHDPAAHHRAPDHGPADHGPADHGPADHGAADHRAAHNRGDDGGPTT
jgi:hypothetical protein